MYRFKTLSKNISSVCAVTFAKGMVLWTEKLPLDHTVKHNEGNDKKLGNLKNIYVWVQ